MKLLNADSIRDGGSLIAFFRQADGAQLSVFLQIDRSVAPGERRGYRDLRTSNDIRPEYGMFVESGSSQERSLFSALQAWLAAPEYSDEWDRDVERRDRQFRKVQALFSEAENRSVIEKAEADTSLAMRRVRAGCHAVSSGISNHQLVPHGFFDELKESVWFAVDLFRTQGSAPLTLVDELRNAADALRVAAAVSQGRLHPCTEMADWLDKNRRELEATAQRSITDQAR